MSPPLESAAAGRVIRRLLPAAACLALAACTTPVYDTLIVNGLVHDGSGTTPGAARIAIRDATIVSLSAPASATAARVIDARGLVVVPGFIDPHTHALDDLKSAERNANLNYLTQGVTTVVVGNDGRGVRERDATLHTLRTQGIGTNVAFFAGHGDLRRRVMGLADRAPTAAEAARMHDLLEDDLRAGALGLSSGLYYAPGSYAHTAELVALARAIAAFGGVYDTHLRVEDATGIGLLGAVEEAILIGREASVPVHISHIKALGAAVWGQSAAVIERIEAARAGGVVVTANQYPWRASGTRFSNALMPRWLMADSKEAMRARLADPAQRERIDTAMRSNLAGRGGADAMLISAASSPHKGRTLAQAAAALGLDPIEAAKRLVLDGDPSIASFVMSEADIDAFARREFVMTGSDGSGGHPRKYATYPKAYRDFVRDRRLMSTARFVARSSGQVAATLGLCDRGYLRPGYRADIAIIDLEEFRPRATYREPTELSTGVVYLLINGRVAIERGEATGARAGQVIHKQRLQCPP